MKKYKSLLSIALVALMAIGIQVATLSAANAATNTDLSIDGRRTFANHAIDIDVCNEGSTAVKEIVLDIDSTNFVFNDSFFNVPETNASNRGSYDVDTSTWTGLLDAGQCFKLIISGNETASLGDSVTTSISIASSIHNVDDAINIDTDNSNDSITFDPYTIALLPDMKTEARLVTTGTISPTDDVEYQVTLSNIGQGTYVNTNSFQYIFVLPEGSAFVSIADNDPGDLLNASSGNCFNYGRMNIEVPIPGADYFTGRQIVICSLSLSSGTELPADDSIYSFNVIITAGTGLASGTADVMGLFQGNDTGTMKYQNTVMNGIQLIDTFDSDPNDNIAFLSYDPSALKATASLCPGQSEISTDGTGCFRIRFNKDIFEPSFDVTDIEVSGSGIVDTLIKVSDNLWEVRVKNIELNKTATISLLLGGIVDYNAVQSDTQVLGINAIRYAVEDSPVNTGNAQANNAINNSASGTLAATGNNGSTSIYAISLILIGFAITFANRKKLITVK